MDCNVADGGVLNTGVNTNVLRNEGDLMENEFKKSGWKVAEIFFGILITISIALTAYSISTLVNVDKRVEVLEHTTMTKDDGIQLYKQIYVVVNEINTRIGLLQVDLQKLPKEIPPPWFEKKVDDTIKRVEALECSVYRAVK